MTFVYINQDGLGTKSLCKILLRPSYWSATRGLMFMQQGPGAFVLVEGHSTVDGGSTAGEKPQTHTRTDIQTQRQTDNSPRPKILS